MAVETDGFTRDEIYTLFVATRIVNFLKGLPLSSSIDLETLVKQRSFAGRTEIGFELLRNLAESGRMYFWTKRGLVENRRFRTEVFWRVISQAATVTCQNGKSISVLGYVDSLSEARRSRVQEIAQACNCPVTSRALFDAHSL